MQIKLAEMYWRYKAVLKNESPLAETKAVLTAAQSTIESFLAAYDERRTELHARRSQTTLFGSSRSLPTREETATSPMASERSARTSPGAPSLAVGFEMTGGEGAGDEWRRGHTVDFRKEMGTIYQYHGVVRYIFNPKVEREEAIIRESLNKSRAIREAIGDYSGLADTLNSIGMLKMSHKLFRDARTIFERVVEIRERHVASDHAGLAQANVSLGEALRAQGRMEAGKKPSDSRSALDENSTAAGGQLAHIKPQAIEKFRAAEACMERALSHYKIAFTDTHPKVANAHQGIAEVLFELGDYAKGEGHLDKAIEIRRSAQDGADGHELFAAEIEKLVSRKERVAELRRPPPVKRNSSSRLWGRALATLAGADSTDLGHASLSKTHSALAAWDSETAAGASRPGSFKRSVSQGGSFKGFLGSMQRRLSLSSVSRPAAANQLPTQLSVVPSSSEEHEMSPTVTPPASGSYLAAVDNV